MLFPNNYCAYSIVSDFRQELLLEQNEIHIYLCEKKTSLNLQMFKHFKIIKL